MKEGICKTCGGHKKVYSDNLCKDCAHLAWEENKARNNPFEWYNTTFRGN